MAIRMTRAQYQQTYGQAPPQPAANSATPIQMTRAQYEAKYGGQNLSTDNTPSAPIRDRSAGNAFGIGDDLTDVGIGVLKGAGSTLATVPKKVGQVAETAGTIAQANAGAQGIDQLQKISNAASQAYMNETDPAKKEQQRQLIKDIQAQINGQSANLPTSNTAQTDKMFSALNPNGTAQNIGYGAEKIGEFMIPGSKLADVNVPGVTQLGKALETPTLGTTGTELASKMFSPAVQDLTNLPGAGARLGNQIGGELGAKIGGGLGTVANNAIRTGAQTGVVSAAQGADLKDVRNSALFGAGASVAADAVSAIAKNLFPNVARKLEEDNLRLTPTQKVNNAKKLGDIEDYMINQVPAVTPQGRYAYVSSQYNNAEDTLQRFLSQDAKGVTVDKQELKDALEIAKNTAMHDSADAPEIGRQFDRAINNLDFQYAGDEIPVARLNALKRSTYKEAYNKTGEKVLDYVEHLIGDEYRGAIETATDGMKINGKSVAEFNQNYGTIINARRLLKMAQNRNQLGLSGRLLSSLLGGAATDALGGGLAADIIGGGVAENIAKNVATPARVLLSKGINNAPQTIRTAAKVAAPFVSGTVAH